MTEPVLAAQRFAIGFALGAVLGLWYGFLRPLRLRHTLLSDLLFLPGAVWVWLQYMFGICRGDLRVSALLALLLGCILWESTIGRFLRPVFAGLWHFASGIADFLLLPCKKIFKNLKILFALLRKSVTIKWSNRRHNRRLSGGTPMAERANPFRNIRFIVRPGPRKLKFLLAALILACAIALVALGVVQNQIQQQTQTALDQAAALEQENAELTEKKENLGSSSSIKEIAKEELGLVDPDTIILDPNS